MYSACIRDGPQSLQVVCQRVVSFGFCVRCLSQGGELQWKSHLNIGPQDEQWLILRRAFEGPNARNGEKNHFRNALHLIQLTIK